MPEHYEQQTINVSMWDLMKKSFSAVLLLMLSWLSAVCQAESLTGDSSYLADTNGYAESTFPPHDNPFNLGGYGVKTSFFESIPWPLIHAAHFLVAYERVVTTNDAALNTKAYSWIPVEAFFAVGWLLERYWNDDSLQLNPMDQSESSQDHPFEITTMMLPGQGQQQNGQQQSGQQNPPSASSGQQASGSTTQLKGSSFRFMLSGSGDDGNQGPEQQQHTYGLNCHVDSCNGVCKLQRPSGSSDLAEGGQQDAPSHARREIEPWLARLLFGNIGSDPSRNPHLPSLEECLIRIAHQETGALSDFEEFDPSSVDEKTLSRLSSEFFVRPILNFLNYRILMNKHDTSDEYVHLAAAMCHALENEYECIVDCCANCAHNFELGFSHPLSRMAELLTKPDSRHLNLHQFRVDVIEGLNTDRQTLVEKIARRESERVNTVLQQGSSIEDKYEPVGNFVLIFFALSANKREEAGDFFRKVCFTDADGNSIPRNPPPEYSTEFTTEPTDTYKYVYSSVRNIKDTTHLQRLVNQLADYLVPDKGAASTSCGNKPNRKTAGE
ncbi:MULTISPECIES: hypothetical protein [unclassified Endozoicomonas]|uniref:hypothetical protein n=1 Tax=unclassified Endozoicomonas TaxID=2644528 RepID=UPI00214925CC|nr:MULTISPECIES: hypothetical protein [unclassified Endozoicomonas]